MQTVLDVADNTGARSVMCIRYWKRFKRISSVGDVIKVNIRMLLHIVKRWYTTPSWFALPSVRRLTVPGQVR
jgi:hypothetical protein